MQSLVIARNNDRITEESILEEVCLCVCVFAHVCVRMYVHLYICTYVHMYIHTFTK